MSALIAEFTVVGTPVPQGSARAFHLDPVLELLSAIRKGRVGNDSFQIAFVHDGDPASKARARYGRGGHTYTPARTVAAQDALSTMFRVALDGAPPLEGNIAIAAVFYRPNHQRIDADNLMKLVLDAATKARVWLDDSQVTAQASVIEFDAEKPRTLIALGPTVSTLIRGPVERMCPRCGKAFSTTRAGRRIYCSPACSQPRATANCARCGTEFHRGTGGAKYCSRACMNADPLRRQRMAEQRPAPRCVTCGGRVSRREYRQCSDCAPKGRRRGSRNVVRVEQLPLAYRQQAESKLTAGDDPAYRCDDPWHAAR